jgi:hypothetical protein
MGNLLTVSLYKEDREARARLRLTFLQLMEQLSGRRAEIHTVEKNTVIFISLFLNDGLKKTVFLASLELLSLLIPSI